MPYPDNFNSAAFDLCHGVDGDERDTTELDQMFDEAERVLATVADWPSKTSDGDQRVFQWGEKLLEATETLAEDKWDHSADRYRDSMRAAYPQATRAWEMI